MDACVLDPNPKLGANKNPDRPALQSQMDGGRMEYAVGSVGVEAGRWRIQSDPARWIKPGRLGR